MKKIDKIKEFDGDIVIRVFECDNFQRVPQDIPIFMSNNLHNSENVKNVRIYDIMKAVENYLYNSGE